MQRSPQAEITPAESVSRACAAEAARWQRIAESARRTRDRRYALRIAERWSLKAVEAKRAEGGAAHA